MRSDLRQDGGRAAGERRHGAAVAARGLAVGTTINGLKFPERQLSFREWQQAGSRIANLVNSSAWYLGDWLTYGETHYEGRYRQAVETVGLNYQTLRNFAWVARRFPLQRRRSQLTFYHHMEVARLPEAEQDHWLDRAVRELWSVRSLRHYLRQSGAKPSAEKTSAAPLVRLTAESTQLDRWLAAARRADADLDDWIVATLDQAAHRLLEASAEAGPTVQQL